MAQLNWASQSSAVPAHTAQPQRAILQRIAQRAMLERGLLPTFSAAASAELQTMQGPASRDPGGDAAGIRDLTNLGWASIDNDDSRDLDQLTVAETLWPETPSESPSLSRTWTRW